MKNRLEDFYMTPYRERTSKKRNCIIIISLLSVTLVVCACLGWYYGKGRTEKTLDNKVLSYICTDVPDEQKYDCYPDAPLVESECLIRGCCYSVQKDTSLKSSLPPLNVPYCYYPSNYTGYAVKHVVKTSRRWLIKLKRIQKSGFLRDISNINVRVSYIDDSSLRIKITDADSERFEVPTQLHYQTKELVDPLYDVKLESNTGLLTVLRKNTETVIFKTDLARLVYSDQFLQLSSDLPSPYIYGIGEHYDGVLRNVNWTRFTLINSDLSPIPNHGLYGSHPFYMVLDENDKASGVFLFNSNIMDVILQPTPAITFRPIGGIFDFYIMAGPTPNDVTRQYSNIVGKTFMPPYWSLGFHLCRYGYNSLQTTKETMERTIEAKIPLDVQWNDIDYMDKYRDFTYNKVAFDGLPEFVENLHSKGMHYVLMIDPGISNTENYTAFDEGVDDDLFVKDTDGSIFIGKVWPGTTAYPDFSHPLATSYWTRQFQRLYDVIKYDGVWIDMNEPSNFINGKPGGCPNSSFENPQYLPGGNALVTKTLCMTAKHYSSIHYNEHNLYGYREAISTYEAIKTVRKKRPFIISRATFSGQGVFSGHWSGDVFSTWEDMRYSIRSLINFNMYAMPMIGSDICGFNGNTSVELCARWQALGAFYPFSRNHNEIDTIPQDPASLGPVVKQAARDALLKRYTLLPYLYTLFYRSHVFGDTVIRSLFSEFPDDKNTYNIDEQFLWGSGLMITQVLYPNTTSTDAYFPKGVWYDAGGGGKVVQSSGENITLDIPVTSIHLSVRGGVILPSQFPALTTTEARKNPFALVVALDENQKAFGELYWDDGDSLNTYENELYNLIQFNVTNGNLTNTVLKNGYQSSMTLTAMNIAGCDKFPSEVTLNGHECNYSSANVSVNSTSDTDDFVENFDVLSQSIFGMGAIESQFAGNDSFCKFFELKSVLIIITNPVSLLSPLLITWK